MSKENELIPSVLDPRPIFDKPFLNAEVARLEQKPSLDLLKWMPTVYNENAIYLIEPNWYALKGFETGIPWYMVPHGTKIFIHSHPERLENEKRPGHVPSLQDFLTAEEKGREYIVSQNGLTEFWRVTDETSRKEFEREIQRFNPIMAQHAPLPEYLNFLNENHAKFEFHSWNNVSEKVLEKFLS